MKTIDLVVDGLRRHAADVRARRGHGAADRRQPHNRQPKPQTGKQALHRTNASENQGT